MGPISSPTTHPSLLIEPVVHIVGPIPNTDVKIHAQSKGKVGH